MPGNYIAVDESNRGRFPEIYVAVYSTDNLDIKVSKENIPKKRKKLPMKNVVGERDFKYVLVPKEFKGIFGVQGIQVVVLSEFIKHFTGQSKKLDLVVVDGRIRESLVDKVTNVIYPSEAPEIRGMVDGDKHIPLVNMADYVAHQLFRYYVEIRKGSKTNQRRGYLKRLLTPRLEEYADLFKR